MCVLGKELKSINKDGLKNILCMKLFHIIKLESYITRHQFKITSINK